MAHSSPSARPGRHHTTAMSSHAVGAHGLGPYTSRCPFGPPPVSDRSPGRTVGAQGSPAVRANVAHAGRITVNVASYRFDAMPSSAGPEPSQISSPACSLEKNPARAPARLIWLQSDIRSGRGAGTAESEHAGAPVGNIAAPHRRLRRGNEAKRKAAGHLLRLKLSRSAVTTKFRGSSVVK